MPDDLNPSRAPRGRGRQRSPEQAADFVEKIIADDLPAGEKARIALRMALAHRALASREEAAEIAIAIAERQQQVAARRRRRREAEGTRELAALGRGVARATLALRPRPLACSGGRHRRASGAGAARRRGSRRGTATRSGPDGGDGSDEPARGRRLEQPRHFRRRGSGRPCGDDGGPR